MSSGEESRAAMQKLFDKAISDIHSELEEEKRTFLYLRISILLNFILLGLLLTLLLPAVLS